METLPDRLDSVARTFVSNNGTLVQGRRGVNFKPGTQIAYTIADNPTTENVDVTIGTTGLGTMATQSSSAVSITGGTITGITDLAVADGGTGASTASGARTNLGLVIGTDVAAYDATQVLPAGMLVPYAGSTAPTGWLLCFGQSLVRADYAALFTAIGTTYGAADGDHFTCPDLRGRTVLTLDNMGGSDAARLSMANTLGGTGGAETRTLTSAESGVPAHAHVHSESDSYGAVAAGASFNALKPQGSGAPTTGAYGINNNTAADAASAHNMLTPYILLNHIIKT